jgi:hypothetical protein
VYAFFESLVRGVHQENSLAYAMYVYAMYVYAMYVYAMYVYAMYVYAMYVYAMYAHRSVDAGEFANVIRVLEPLKKPPLPQRRLGARAESPGSHGVRGRSA